MNSEKEVIEMTEHDRFIIKVSKKDDRNGSHLLEMMDYYGVLNLHDLTLPEIKEYLVKIMGNTD